MKNRKYQSVIDSANEKSRPRLRSLSLQQQRQLMTQLSQRTLKRRQSAAQRRQARLQTMQRVTGAATPLPLSETQRGFRSKARSLSLLPKQTPRRRTPRRRKSGDFADNRRRIQSMLNVSSSRRLPTVTAGRNDANGNGSVNDMSGTESTESRESRDKYRRYSFSYHVVSYERQKERDLALRLSDHIRGPDIVSEEWLSQYKRDKQAFRSLEHFALAKLRELSTGSATATASCHRLRLAVACDLFEELLDSGSGRGVNESVKNRIKVEMFRALFVDIWENAFDTPYRITDIDERRSEPIRFGIDRLCAATPYFVVSKTVASNMEGSEGSEGTVQKLQLLGLVAGVVAVKERFQHLLTRNPKQECFVRWRQCAAQNTQEKAKLASMSGRMRQRWLLKKTTGIMQVWREYVHRSKVQKLRLMNDSLTLQVMHFRQKQTALLKDIAEQNRVLSKLGTHSNTHSTTTHGSSTANAMARLLYSQYLSPKYAELVQSFKVNLSILKHFKKTFASLLCSTATVRVYNIHALQCYEGESVLSLSDESIALRWLKHQISQLSLTESTEKWTFDNLSHDFESHALWLLLFGRVYAWIDESRMQALLSGSGNRAEVTRTILDTWRQHCDPKQQYSQTVHFQALKRGTDMACNLLMLCTVIRHCAKMGHSDDKSDEATATDSDRHSEVKHRILHRHTSQRQALKESASNPVISVRDLLCFIEENVHACQRVIAKSETVHLDCMRYERSSGQQLSVEQFLNVAQLQKSFYEMSFFVTKCRSKLQQCYESDHVWHSALHRLHSRVQRVQYDMAVGQTHMVCEPRSVQLYRDLTKLDLKSIECVLHRQSQLQSQKGVAIASESRQCQRVFDDSQAIMHALLRQYCADNAPTLSFHNWTYFIEEWRVLSLNPGLTLQSMQCLFLELTTHWKSDTSDVLYTPETYHNFVSLRRNATLSRFLETHDDFVGSAFSHQIRALPVTAWPELLVYACDMLYSDSLTLSQKLFRFLQKHVASMLSPINEVRTLMQNTDISKALAFERAALDQVWCSLLDSYDSSQPTDSVEIGSLVRLIHRSVNNHIGVLDMTRVCKHFAVNEAKTRVDMFGLQLALLYTAVHYPIQESLLSPAQEQRYRQRVMSKSCRAVADKLAFLISLLV